MPRLVLAQHIQLELLGPLENFTDYDDLIVDLDAATERDVIDLVINSPGGDCGVGQMIIRAIQRSRALVRAVVVYPSYSMASIISLACDDLVIEPGAFLMFHNYSTVIHGKGDEIKQMAANVDLSLVAMMDVCKPFLTPKEIKMLEHDKDVYITSDDPTLEQRIKKHYKN